MAKVLNSTRGAVAGILLVFALLAAACGGDEGGSTAEADSGPGDEADLAGTNDDDDPGPEDDAGGDPAEGDEPAEGATPDSSDGEDPDDETEPPEPAEPEYPIEFTGGLPAGGRWGVLEITLERLFLDLIDPGSLISSNPRESDTPNIFAEVTIENTHTIRPASVDNRLFTIRLADGTEYRATDVGRDLRYSIGGLTATRDLVGFNALDPVTTLEGASLLIGLDETPLEIAEDGTIVGDPDPVEFPIEGSGDSLGVEIGACEKPMTSTITGASLQLNSGLTTTEDVWDFDLDSHRAAVGSVFLVLDYESFNQGGGIICGGSGGAPRVRLLIDGVPIVPQWASTWQNPAGTTTPSQSGWLVTPGDDPLTIEFGIDQTWSVELDPAVVFAELPT